jgi:Flp pilus assembly secretin CpaC
MRFKIDPIALAPITRASIAHTSIALASVALAWAAASSASAETLKVALDHSTRLPVRDAASVIVANPSVADVMVVDNNTVFVLGKNFGSTDIVVLNHTGRAVFNGDVEVTDPSSNVAVFRGAERTDFSCSDTCAKSQHAAGASAGH